MEFKELFEKFLQPGAVEWIGIRPDRKIALKEVSEVMAIKDLGLEGDRYHNKGGPRQVTLIQQEHLNSIASFLEKLNIDPQLTRRNIVVKRINLLALKGKQFSIGEAILEYSGDCHPCSRMEEKPWNRWLQRNARPRRHYSKSYQNRKNIAEGHYKTPSNKLKYHKFILVSYA
jgi:MOSC domain-containing protein YiiM